MAAFLSFDRRRPERAWFGFSFAALLALLVAGSLAGVTHASIQSPPAGAECTVEPRAAEELLDLWFGPEGTPQPSYSSSLTTERGLDATLGEPADAATVEVIEDVVHEWVECVNAGDELRAHALFTDDYAQQRGPFGPTREETNARLTAAPSPRTPEAALGVGPALHPRVFPDGQVGAMFSTVGVKNPGDGLTVFMTFTQLDDGWRISGMIGLVVPPLSAPVSGFDVIAEYPHDLNAYTQGLVLVDGTVIESTGLKGKSGLQRLDLETGDVLQSHALDSEYFGEGVAVHGERIYQLTWQSGTCFVYDRQTFEVLETLSYDGEGWGLTTDGDRLIMSDGSNRLVFRNTDTFEELGSIEVEDGSLPVTNLNELEYVDGEVWANVYQTNLIARIDPASGHVVGWVDLTGLLSPDAPGAENAEVLNGTAYDSETGQLVVTGKLWPRMFEIQLVPAE